MKKIFNIIICVALFCILSAPVATYAVSGTQTAADLLTALQAQITNLKNQITALTAQLEVLRQAQSTVKEAEKDVKGTLQLLNQLSPGMTSEEVKKLQEIMATDPSIYPEGRITGYFGKLTEKAVRKLQNKFCLTEVGSVGSRTLEKINELLEEGDDDHSGKVPKGLLKKLELQNKFCTPAAPDTTAPVISNIKTENITANTAKIKWSTNEKANGKIWYSATTPVVTTGDPTKTSSDYEGSHEIKLTGLTASTIYYYIVASTDKSGNVTKSAEGSFTTSALDTTTPVISNVQVIDIEAHEAEIKWSTNKEANSKIWYGTTTPIITTGDPTKTSSDYDDSNDIELTGLTANTTYYYVVASTDRSGNTTKSAEGSFTTLAQ